MSVVPASPVAAEPTLPAAAVPAAEVAVRATALTYAYRERRALDGVDFVVPAGAVFGFLGPNGSGKTTLFRILATLLPPGGGRVEVLGTALAAGGGAALARVRRELGVVFQLPGLDLRLTVRENLLHQGHLYGLRGRRLALRIGEALARFDLGDRRDDRAEALSGGLRRRVELAKALLHGPRLLLLDEPATGLDPRARRDLWAVLGRLRDEGVTVMLTTHFLEEAERCDRLVLLDGGRVVAAGSPDELTREIGGEVVTVSGPDPVSLREALGAALAGEPLAARPAVLAGTVRFELAGGTGAWALLSRLAARLPDWERRVTAVTVARATLEDVFLRHTGHGLSAAPAAEEAP